MNEEKKAISFGLEETMRGVYGTGSIGSIYSINAHEHILTTTRNLYKIEKSQIKKSLPYQFLVTCYIPEYDLIVGYSAHGSELFVLEERDLEHPITAHFQTEHNGVFHLLFSERSSLLVLVGSGVSVWHIKVTVPENAISITKPIVEIKLRARFAQGYDTVILNSPSFDYQRELIFLPTPEGICAFDMDGQIVRHVTKLASGNNTVFGYSQKLRRLMTVDQESSISLWDFDGYNCGTFSISASAFFSVLFLDQEHVLLMNAKGIMFILNLKTRKSFHVYTAEKLPTRLILQRDPELAVIMTFQSAVVFLKVTLPWKMWTENIIMPKSIRRVPKLEEAARVIVHTNDSLIRMISPITKRIITVASPKSLALPSYVAYDRGCLVYFVRKRQTGDDQESTIPCLNVELPTSQFDCEIFPGCCKRDDLFMVMSNGFLCRFDTGSDPCKEVSAQDIKAGVVSAFFDQTGAWGYAVCSPKGEAFLCDYKTLKVTKRFRVTPYPVDACNIFFFPNCGVLVFLYLTDVYVYNIKTGLITQKMPIAGSRQSYMFGNYVFIGHENGTIDILEMVDGVLTAVNMSSDQKIHAEGVSGMAFSPSFWISVALDGSIVLWDYHFMIIGRINLPEPIYACEILNGRKDIIVGTNSEIMIISGAEVFGEDSVEDEIELLDNFDGKVDALVEDFYVEPPKEEKEEDLLFKHVKGKGNKALNTTGKRGKLRNILKQQRERFKFDPEALQVLNRLNEEGDPVGDRERLNALREMQQMGETNPSTETAPQVKLNEDNQGLESPRSSTSKRKKKRRKTSTRKGDSDEEDDDSEMEVAEPDEDPDGKAPRNRRGDDSDEYEYYEDENGEMKRRRKRRNSDEYEYYEDENGQRKRRRKNGNGDSDYEYYEDEDGQRKRRRKKDDDEYDEDENDQRKRKGKKDEDDEYEYYEDENGERKRRRKKRNDDDEYEYYEDENGERKRRRKNKGKDQNESDDNETGKRRKKRGQNEDEDAQRLQKQPKKQQSTDAGHSKVRASQKENTGDNDDESEAVSHKKKAKTGKSRNDDDDTETKSKVKRANRGAGGDDNETVETSNTQTKQDNPDEKQPKRKKAKKPKRKSGKQNTQNIDVPGQAQNDASEEIQIKARPRTPPSIRPRRIGSSILRRLTQGNRSRSRLEKRMKLLASKGFPAVILDQETLVTRFVRGQTDLLPFLKAIKKSTINAKQFRSPESARPNFSKTMQIAPPPTPNPNPRRRGFNWTTNAIPRAAVITIPDQPSTDEPVDELEEIMDEAKDWQRIPITARVVAYGGMWRGHSETDMLADAVLQKMPEMRSCALFKPKKTDSNKLYRSVMRPKVVQPIGKVENSITVRHSINGRLHQKPLDDLKPV